MGVPGSLPGCLFAGDRLTASSPPALLRIRIPFRDLIVPEPGIPSVDAYVCVSGDHRTTGNFFLMIGITISTYTITL